MDKSQQIETYMTEISIILIVQFVLFGFRTNLALHLERSPLNHSYGYASADDRPSCFASFALIPESFMQYAG